MVVPKILQVDMLTKIHEGYLGMEKCKCRGRDLVYWPQMNKEREKSVKMCETCQKYQPTLKRTSIDKH